MVSVDSKWSVNEAVAFVRPDVPPFEDLVESLKGVFASGIFTKGQQLAAFEVEVAAALETGDAVGVSSCTQGLMLVLKALAERDGPTSCRNEVIMPSFVFLASPAAAVWAGMRPVFVEINPATWTVAPEAVEEAISDRTLAILGCHTFGNPCCEERLEEIACRNGIDLVMDAAHGFGSSIHGSPVGRRGTAQVFSLSPTKLVVAGEGGVVATSDADLAARLREAREYGNDGSYGCNRPGLNGRLPEMAAALARVSLARLPEVRLRRAAASRAYSAILDAVEGVSVQQVHACSESSWKDYAIRVSAEQFGLSRDALRTLLAAEGIDTRAYYAPPCHAMAAYRGYRRATSLDETELLSSECLALPMGRHVTPEVAAWIATIIGGAGK